MAARVNPPGSSAVVEISDELLERYVAQGWTVVGSPAPAEGKYLSQQNKPELIATAVALGLEADDSLSKKDLLELIEAAKSEQK